MSTKFDFNAELEKCSTIEDLTGKNGLLQRMVGGMIEKILEREISEHLGYEKHAVEGYGTGNSRNGKSVKTLESAYGPVEVEVPRDRTGTFEPQIIPKRKRTISGLEEKIISMYAKGMSLGDIQSCIKEMYGADISKGMLSSITDQVMGAAKEWQSRALQDVYAAVFFDAIHFKVREEGRVVCKAVYTCLGVNIDGVREVLGVWVGESEGAKFWLRVCTELQQRGVKDILISCMDGLKGLPEAIQTVFPQTEVQLCVVHMIRNSLKFIPHKHYKEFLSDLKAVYQADTERAGKEALKLLTEKWGAKYSAAVKPWNDHWDRLSTYFQFPADLRRMIYTTNAVEALHRQFRKVTKSKAVFPTDDSLLKMMYLIVQGLSEKWTKPMHGWKQILSSLALVYGDRVATAVAM